MAASNLTRNKAAFLLGAGMRLNRMCKSIASKRGRSIEISGGHFRDNMLEFGAMGLSKKIFRGAGLAILLVFALQVMLTTFCAIPDASAASVGITHHIVHMQCPMKMDMHDADHCAHCNIPVSHANINVDHSSDLSPVWAFIAVMPSLVSLVDADSAIDSLFYGSDEFSQSTSLIYKTTLRIRL